MVSMQQVWPEPSRPVDHLDVYEEAPRPHSPERPWVILCMIATVDGAVTVKGRSGPLGGPADWAVLTGLRGCADAIVVGAGTARTEDYGPPTVAADVRERRRQRGQRPEPLLAVVSARGDLDPSARLFSGPEPTRLYLAAGAAPQRRRSLESVADVRTAGESSVEASAVVEDLAAEGRSLILLEGGPRLNNSFAAADLIDEFCITRSPLLATGGPGILEGDPLPAALDVHLDRLLVADGMVFARFLRRRRPHVPA